MQQENIKVTGILYLDLFDSDGNLKDSRELKNIMTESGKDYIVDALADTMQDHMKYIGIGTGNAAAAATNTALENEVGSRGAGTVTDGGNTYQVIRTFASGNPATSYAIQEAGMFSTISGSTLGSRQIFATINKATADSLQITWRWIFS